MNSEERKQVLEMVADGKIDIHEATRLLSGAKMGEPDSQELVETLKEKEAEKPFIPEIGNGGRPRWFHVHVSDSETGKSKVRVNIPIQLVKFGLAMGKRFTPEMKGIDIDEISSFMSNEKGLLVDVQDDEDGERVLIFVD
jgi:hypothetical protein